MSRTGELLRKLLEFQLKTKKYFTLLSHVYTCFCSYFLAYVLARCGCKILRCFALVDNEDFVEVHRRRTNSDFNVFMKRNFLPQFFYCIRKMS